MKRALLFILAIILLILGLIFGLIGGAIASIVGPSGSASTGVGKVSDDGYALVFNEFAINTVIESDSIKGMIEFSLQAKSTTANQVFIGIGTTKDVNNYLSGSARGVVSDITKGSARVVPIPGPNVPTSPDEQKFWLAQAQGASPQISLEKATANTTLVIMNVVPSKPVGADLYLGGTSSSLFPIGLGLLIFGVLLFVLGVFALVKGIRGKKKPPPVAVAPAAPSPLSDYSQTAQPPVQAPPTQPPPAPPTPPTQPPAQG